jgi:peptidyl-prolyl cis-trans isomerase D
VLLNIRENMQSWVLWVIVILISIPFALWGINSYFSAASEVVVAKVGDTEIELRDYQRSMAEYKRRLRAVLGQNYSAEVADSELAKKAVLDNMIERELVSQYLVDAGFATGDARVAEQIITMPEFQRDGKFDSETYKRMISIQGMNEEMFENRIRREMAGVQFEDGLYKSSFITPVELSEISRLRTQTRTASIATIDSAQIDSEADVSDAAISEYYENTKENYAIPEALKLEYVELAVKDLSPNVAINDSDLQSAYEQNKNSLKTNELRKYSHILLTVPNAENDAEVLAKAQEIKSKIDAGGDFAALAKEHSADFGSAQNGGDMGYQGRGVLGDELEQVLFKLAEGEVSDPVRSRFGYHILKLSKIKAPEIKSFAEAKEQLAIDEKTRRAQEEFFNKAEEFANLSYEHGDTLAPIVDALGLKAKTTGWVTRAGVVDLFKDQRVANAVFSDEVIQDGQNSEVIELADDHMIVLRAVEHRPKAYQNLADVKDKVKSDLIETNRQKILAEQGDKLVAELGEGSSNLKDKFGLSFGESKTYTLESELGFAIKEKLFAMPKPDGNARYAGVAGVDKYTVIKLTEVALGDSADVSDEFYRSLKSELESLTYSSFISKLHRQIGVKVFYDQVLDSDQ